MNKVFISGHKNPDTDSICSALAYADLKKQLDPKNDYIAIRPGNLNPQTKYIFDRLQISPPKLARDIHPRVGDIMTTKVSSVDENDPVYIVMQQMENRKFNVTPVVKMGVFFQGVISVIEISSLFMRGSVGARPYYRIRPDNFSKVIAGEYRQRGFDEEFEATIITGAMPFEDYFKHMEGLDSHRTILVVGKREEIIRHGIDLKMPAIIITGMREGEIQDKINLEGYKGWVFHSYYDTAETIRRITLSVPAKSIMNTEIRPLSPKHNIDEAREIILSQEHKSLPVLQDDRLVGIIARSDLLKKNRSKLIMMDHNEINQAVDGAEYAEILEIVDHHRLGTVKTNAPVHFYAKPVGSTCTLVYEQYKFHNVNIDKQTAAILLSGILSDTVILKSPTTTNVDEIAVKDLASIAGLDYQEYGVQIFSSTNSLKSRTSDEIVFTDFKIYDEYKRKIGIGQVEVVTHQEVPEVRQQLVDTLRESLRHKRLDWAMLLITDIVHENSLLLTSGFEPADNQLMYKRIGANEFELPGVLSRKKQLLPEVLRVLEEIGGRH